MYIRELTIPEFEEYTRNSTYANFHQTLSYALLKSEHDYEFEIIGFVDDENIYVAALVLVKLIEGRYLYAYIPEGFLTNYHDEDLIIKFTNSLYKYYKKENIIFIKINPPIIIGEYTGKKHLRTYNENYDLIKIFTNAGYLKLKNNIYFESMLPRINAIIELDKFSDKNLTKNTRNKIRKGIRKGLTFEIGNIDQINHIYEFTKDKINRDIYYYNDYYNIFSRENAIDYFVISIDYNKYIVNSQRAYEMEKKKNEEISERIMKNPNDRNVNKKMNSDKALFTYKNDISIAARHLNEGIKPIIAGALVVKHGDTATIVINGYDKTYSDFAPNYYLFYEILRYYHNNFKYVNLNGMTGDFTKANKYHGLNIFKMGFKPRVYEYIGEFDLVINYHVYNSLERKGILAKEFNDEN